MKKGVIILILFIYGVAAGAAEWSFSGGYVYFDNSTTGWTDNSLMLIIGKGDYSSVYEMTRAGKVEGGTWKAEGGEWWYTALPTSGWGDATYMAIIGGDKVWRKGEWGMANIENANHYASYTAGLKASAGQGYVFTVNGHTMTLSYKGDGFTGVTFTDAEKSACYTIDEIGGTVTFICSSDGSRFNTGKRTDVAKVYVYGSITAWEKEEEAYRLTGWSDDGCYYRTMPLSALERIGNSGQPEFLMNIIKYNGNAEAEGYTERAHSTWPNVDSRLLFENGGGVNMVVALPGDDKDEIHSRCERAKKIDGLSDFDLSEPSEQERIANWRLVPGTKMLYRSYHPYDPSRDYGTEERRLYYVGVLGARYGVQGDIALSGDMTGHAGKTYSCGGQTYTVTIPSYYQQLIAGNKVLYVGTRNGKVPTYKTALFESEGPVFGEWIKEVVEWILDEGHPGPYEIHCALGSDRTGAFCATIAALCDASWEAIAADYEGTTAMNVAEYRHRNCIRACLKRMCGVDPASEGWNAAVKGHFVEHGFLTEAQIAALKTKLNDVPSAVESGKLKIESGKYLQNGVLYIQKDFKTYDVSGRIYNAVDSLIDN